MANDTEKKKVITGYHPVAHQILVVLGAGILTLSFFLVLPVMQTLAKGPANDLTLQEVDTVNIPPPPPPPEEEPEEEPEPEEPPPELNEEVQPLDLNQLELALNPGFGDGWLGGDFAVKLNTVTGNNKNVDALFSVADLDQKPRVIYQPGPTWTKEMRKRRPGKVEIVFVVNGKGRVEDAKVLLSSDTVFEKAAMSALKKWKFEPGKKNGQPVRFRMKVPFSF